MSKKIKPIQRSIMNQLDKHKLNTKDHSTDLWYIINEKYDIEIDGINTLKTSKKAKMWVWINKQAVILEISNIPHEDVVTVIHIIEKFTIKLTDDDIKGNSIAAFGFGPTNINYEVEGLNLTLGFTLKI
ncbi:MAG: hypothetical protein SO148_04955 [Candidatus Onthovivens sp.]|nr:hypothetical protein [Candidatus Onthovivens sp.]